MLGGGANATRNARACGATVSLFGVDEADEAGREVMGLVR
jgi:bifunctional ADP-heptose synthase (sugar kinase/adenylyltransferase)